MCKVSPVKASLKPSSRQGYEGLKRLSDRLAIQVQAIQSLSELRQFFLQSPFIGGLGIISGGVADEGARSCSSLGHSKSCCCCCRLRLLGIYVHEHGHDNIQVVMSI